MVMSRDDTRSCERILSGCEMFQKVPPKLLSQVVGNMTTRIVNKNEKFVIQGRPVDSFHLLESGEIQRKTIDKQGRSHKVEFAIKAQSINTMRVISGEDSFATVKCVSEKCKLYEMKRDVFLKMLEQNPELSTSILEGLCEQLRIGSKKFATPLLEQQNKDDVNVPAVSIAAGIESYYRSALNSMLNARLTGIKGDWSVFVLRCSGLRTLVQIFP